MPPSLAPRLDWRGGGVEAVTASLTRCACPPTRLGGQNVIIMQSTSSTKFHGRVTFFPFTDVSTGETEWRAARVQFCTRPTFRAPGWEDVKAFGSPTPCADPFPCGEDPDDDAVAGSEPPTPSARAIRRARQNAYDLLMCNPSLDAFVTLTFDPATVDSFSYPDAYDYLRPWLSNRVQRRGLAYVLVPELHPTSGRIHFHALMNGDALGDLPRAFDPHTGKPIFHKGRAVYNVAEWHAGFSTLMRVQKLAGKPDTTAAVSRYMFKYMGKNLGATIGGRYFLHGGRLQKPRYTYIDNLDEAPPLDAATKYTREVLCPSGGSMTYTDYNLR